MKSVKQIKKTKNLKEKIFLIHLFLIPLIFILIWFWPAQQLANGEEGFSIFNDRNIFALNGYWEDIGTGFANPTNLGRIILSFFVAGMRFIELPFWFSQAILFYFLIVVGLISVYFLAKKLFPAKKEESSFIYFTASLFYLLNIYSMTQIWGRFLYAHMYAWAFLPLFLLLWINWIEKPTIRRLLLLVFGSFIFSLAYMQPAFVLTLWAPALVWSIIQITQRIKEKKYGSIIFTTLGGVFAWVITNIWWIYPYIVLSKATFAEKMNLQSNIDSLRGVSQYFPTDQILTLRQNFLLGEMSPWHNFYTQGWVIGITIVLVLVVFVGLIKSKGEKNWIFLVTLFVLGWFVSKGTNPPLGDQIYSFLFSTIPFSAVLRNSYEKFGIVFLLPYSIFFALGLGWIRNILSEKKRVGFSIGILFLVTVLVWPLWTGNIFNSARITIPQAYEKVNSLVNKDSGDNRILVLPLLPGDGIHYTWEYTGVEPSEYFFDKVSVSKILRQRYFDEAYMQLYNLFIAGDSIDKNLNEMNIKYLLVHHDMFEKERNASPSAEVERLLNSSKNIKKIARIDNLSLYQYKSGQDQSLFVAKGEKVPHISYKKVTSERYTVTVTNASDPFVLIFKNTFHPLWSAQIGGKKLEKHFVINTYANAWNVDKTGNYQLDVRFTIWPWE